MISNVRFNSNSFRRWNYNPGQNIWTKTEKFRKTGQEKKGINLLLRFFNCYCQSLISGREIGHKIMSRP